MSRTLISYLQSLLKYLDEMFMVDEVFWEVKNLNIHIKEDQIIIIKKMIFPYFLNMDEETRLRFLSYLDEIIGSELDCSEAFEHINSYFEFKELDYLNFVNNLYQELKLNNQ